MGRIWALLWGALGWGVSASFAGAAPLSLNDLLDRVDTTSAELQEHDAKIDEAQALLDQVLGSSGPSFSMRLFAGPTSKARGDQVTSPDSQWRLSGLSDWEGLDFSVIQPLAGFGRFEAYKRAAEANIVMEEAAKEVKRAELRQQVRALYFGAWVARDITVLLQESLDRVEKAIGIVEDALDEGNEDFSSVDLLKLKSGKGKIDGFMPQAKAAQLMAVEALRGLLRLGPNETVELPNYPIQAPSLPADALAVLQSRALEQRPEMQQVAAGLAATQALSDAEQANGRPVAALALVGSAAHAGNRSRIDNPFINDPFNHLYGTVLVALQWEINMGVHDAKVAQAQAKAAQVAAKERFARTGIPLQVMQAYYETLQYNETVKGFRDAYKAGNQWLVAAYADFEMGVGQAKEVFDALSEYTLNRVAYLQAVYALQLSTGRLVQAVGGDKDDR